MPILLQLLIFSSCEIIIYYREATLFSLCLLIYFIAAFIICTLNNLIDYQNKIYNELKFDNLKKLVNVVAFLSGLIFRVRSNCKNDIHIDIANTL